MARVPKTDPNIYQVDLVAGLFGAFMLVWISGAQESEYPGDQVNAPTFAALELTAIVDDGVNRSMYSLVPADAINAACLGPDYLNSVNLTALSDVKCPYVLERRLFNVPNAVWLAVTDGNGCWSSTGAPPKPWKYSYSLVTESLNIPGFALRGIFETTRKEDSGALPNFETFFQDPTKSMSEYIAYANESYRSAGVVDSIICYPEVTPRQSVLLFSVNEEKLDVWSLPSIAMTSNFEVFDGLIVMGEGEKAGVVAPTLWTIRVNDPTDQSKRVVPNNWDQATLTAKLCVHRDGAKRCFGGDVPIAERTVTLTWVPDA